MRWDWLVLATAAYISFVVIRYWYQVWSVHDFPGITRLSIFLGFIVENLLLYLMVASALPDEEDFIDGRVDLIEFGEQTRPYFWKVYLLFALSWAAHGLFLFGGFSVMMCLIFLVPLLLAFGLAFTRRRSIQVGLFLALVLQECWWMAISFM